MLYSETNGGGQKTIIFVHGNSQSLHTWDEVNQQDSLLNYTKVMVDLPGHGRSFHSLNPEADYCSKGLAFHLHKFLEQYQQKDYLIVGTSLGTSITSELNPFPPACKGVLFSGAMLSSENISVKDMIQPGVSIAAAFKADATEEEIDHLIDNFIFCAGKEVKEHYKQVYKATDPNLRAYLGKSLGSPPVIDKIRNISNAHIPVAIIYGEEERIVQSDYLSKTTLPIWMNHIFKIPDAGHCVELDQPKLLADLIAKFAKSCFDD